MEKTVFIIRHGETAMNKMGIVQGSGVDAPINNTGRKQAKAFFDFYQKENFDLVISSALIRTHQTVEPFVNAGIPWLTRADINEISWGIHEGRPGSPAMIAEYKSMRQQWQAGNLDARIEKGESAWELMQRLDRFISELRIRQEQKILVCSHGRAIRCLMCLLKGVPLSEMENVRHANTGLYHVDYDGVKFEVLKENDVQHLKVSDLFTDYI